MKKKTKKKPPSPIYFLVSPLSRPRKSTRARSRPNAETRVQEERVSPRTMVLLDVESIKSMAPGRFFRDHKGPINSLDFHHSEDLLVTTGAFAVEKWDGSISLTRHPCPPPLFITTSAWNERRVSPTCHTRGHSRISLVFCAATTRAWWCAITPACWISRANLFLLFLSPPAGLSVQSLTHHSPPSLQHTPTRQATTTPFTCTAPTRASC